MMKFIIKEGNTTGLKHVCQDNRQRQNKIVFQHEGLAWGWACSRHSINCIKRVNAD